MRWTTRLSAGALAVVLAAGCAAFEDADEAGPTDLTTADRDADVPAVDAPDRPIEEPADEADMHVSEDGVDDGEARTVATGAPTGQKVVRTAELVLESSDTAETLGRIRAVADRAGGYTATSDLQRDEEGVVRGTVTLRVPTEELSEVVDELEALGDAVPVNRIDERDVTTEHADLQARIQNLTSYETELRALLTEIRESTDRPEDLLHIFERIRQVREEIDLLEGRLAALSDQIAYATVTVTLRPVDDETGPGPDEAAPWAPGETFREALAATGRLLAALGDGLIWLVVTGIPVLVSFLGPPALLLYLVIRWFRQRPEAGQGPTPPPRTADGPDITPQPPAS